MKKTLLLLLTLLSTSLKAQINLVPNWSFEDTVACPVNGRLYNCKYWVNCGQTPDYNHSCAPQGNAFGVPFNTVGYQPAATGNAYCDLWTYSTTQLFREFIGVSLIQPMVVGKNYFVSFKCSPASPYSGYGLQSNKQGIKFSTVVFDSLQNVPINNFAHIYTDNIVTDTVNWTTVSGSFIADSAYTFLSVGNFFDDANTDTLIPFSNWAFAVYYIDDVEVIDSTTSVNETNFNYFIHYWQAGNELIFTSASMKVKTVVLFDCSGRRLPSKVNINENGLVMDIGEIATGIYIAVLTIHNKQISIKCFIQKT